MDVVSPCAGPTRRHPDAKEDRRSIGVPYSPVKIGLSSHPPSEPVVDTVRAAVLRFFRVSLGTTGASECQDPCPPLSPWQTRRAASVRRRRLPIWAPPSRDTISACCSL